MAAPNASEVAALTIEYRSKTVADNFSKRTALLDHLRGRGRMKMFSGGTLIRLPLAYSEAGSFSYATGYDPLNVSPWEAVSAADYSFTQAYVSTTISGTEQLANSGEQAQLDLWAQKLEIAEQTLTNQLGLGVYSDGTAFGGRQINGLSNIISTAPTSGTVGSINRALWTFWRNVAFSGTTDGGAAVTSANIASYFGQCILRTTVDGFSTTAIFADNNYYMLYMAFLQTNQRIVTADSSSSAGAGFKSIDFWGIPVYVDGGMNGSCPVNRAYGICAENLCLYSHSDLNFTKVGNTRVPVNQHAQTQIMGWAGQMTANSMRNQWVLVP